ncbi:copper resistance CopC family protein [Amorphus orientalis]|uniref:Methionine-rich copper-binding protein CopC n=1 Tax=Amorphus orientalis TaxID=649198 RepID=A0AAE3VQ90_9HYPH|nr:copper resistance CopC family protein [Amorphus orientalis]MDQ0316294.1 methionine-rich copper-binding protein CopC [Amorphus orientalis]
MTSFRNGALGAFAAAAMSVAVLSGASAHSKKETTTPPDGAVLEAAPQSIGMSFDKPMRITLIRLTGADGESHDLERTDDMAPVREFEATPGDLAPGTYTVDWRGLSDDGHPMEGSFSFEIGN